MFYEYFHAYKLHLYICFSPCAAATVGDAAKADAPPPPPPAAAAEAMENMEAEAAGFRTPFEGGLW